MVVKMRSKIDPVMRVRLNPSVQRYSSCRDVLTAKSACREALRR